MGIQYVNLVNERIGKTGMNKQGSLMEIVKYNNANDVFVQFYKGKPIHTNWASFIIGEVKNPYDKTIYGIGYIGEGEHKANENNKNTPQYSIWRSMLQRCYDDEFHKKYPTYKDCTVTEEWLNFQNFTEWYIDNYYEVDKGRMNLDKDMLIKGNKIYSPETCIFVPQKVNLLIVKNDAIRGDLPIGIHFEKQTNKYKAQCKIGNGQVKNLGRFDTIEDAFLVYKKFKEKYIKQVAEGYKDRIPKKLYNAMITYEVDITD